jgi:hypothetical protein
MSGNATQQIVQELSVTMTNMAIVYQKQAAALLAKCEEHQRHISAHYSSSHPARKLMESLLAELQQQASDWLNEVDNMRDVAHILHNAVKNPVDWANPARRFEHPSTDTPRASPLEVNELSSRSHSSSLYKAPKFESSGELEASIPDDVALAPSFHYSDIRG